MKNLLNVNSFYRARTCMLLCDLQDGIHIMTDIEPGSLFLFIEQQTDNETLSVCHFKVVYKDMIGWLFFSFSSSSNPKDLIAERFEEVLEESQL